MLLDQNARNRIKEELVTTRNLLADPDSEKLWEAEERLDKLTYELEILVQDASSLAPEEARVITELLAALEEKLTERAEVGGKVAAFMYHMLSRLKSITATLKYYLESLQ